MSAGLQTASTLRKAAEPLADPQLWQREVGLRVVLAVVGSVPFLLLVTLVPWLALRHEIVRVPDILVSDMMAATPHLRSFYTSGLGLGAGIMLMTWSEFVRFIKAQTVNGMARRALDQYLATVWLVLVPAILLVVSFMFDYDSSDLSVWMHCIAAVLVFAGFLITSLLYLVHIAPQCREEHLEPANDEWRKRRVAQIMSVTVALTCPVRLAHVFVSREFWAYPMLYLEVIALFLAYLATVWGNIGLLAHLDATDPLLSWRNLKPSAWLGSCSCTPAVPQRVMSRSRLRAETEDENEPHGHGWSLAEHAKRE